MFGQKPLHLRVTSLPGNYILKVNEQSQRLMFWIFSKWKKALERRLGGFFITDLEKFNTLISCFYCWLCPTPGQCSIFIPPENMRKPFLTFSGGIEMEHWANIGSVCLLLMEKIILRWRLTIFMSFEKTIRSKVIVLK